jgi:predicted neutral ceramidase superfamily lipid hydrolase
MLSLASSKSSNEIDTVSVDDVEKIVSEIASEDENWCPPEVNLKTYS